MWTIGVADRLRFPHFPSQLGKRGNAHLRPLRWTPIVRQPEPLLKV